MPVSPFASPGHTHLGTVFSDGTGSVAGTFFPVTPSFDTLMLDVSGLIPKTALDSVVVQFGTGTPVTWGATNYSWMLSTVLDNAATTVATVNSSAVGVNLGQCDSTSSTSMAAVLYLKNMQSPNLFKSVVGEGTVSSGTAFGATQISGVWHGSASVITGVRVAAVTGSVSSGATISLYGIMV